MPAIGQSVVAAAVGVAQAGVDGVDWRRALSTDGVVETTAAALGGGDGLAPLHMMAACPSTCLECPGYVGYAREMFVIVLLIALSSPLLITLLLPWLRGRAPTSPRAADARATGRNGAAGVPRRLLTHRHDSMGDIPTSYVQYAEAAAAAGTVAPIDASRASGRPLAGGGQGGGDGGAVDGESPVGRVRRAAANISRRPSRGGWLSHACLRWLL